MMVDIYLVALPPALAALQNRKLQAEAALVIMAVVQASAVAAALPISLPAH
jgi:hypothetical protein